MISTQHTALYLGKVFFIYSLVWISFLFTSIGYTQPLRLQWAQTGGGDYIDWANITLDDEGNVLVAGAISSPAQFAGRSLPIPAGNFQDIFIAKLRPDGDLIWINSSGGDYIDSANSIATNSSGQILIGGFFRDEFSFFSGPTLTSVGNPEFGRTRDAYVALFQPNGTLVWVKQGGSEIVDYSFGVTFNQTGDALATGRLARAANFAGTRTHAEARGSLFVSNHQVTDGTLNSIIAHGYANGTAIAKMSDGGYVVVGELLGNTDFGNGYPRYPRGGSDAFVARYNASNELVFIYTTSGSGLDGAYGVAVASDGRIYVAGEFIGDMVIRPGLVLSSSESETPYSDGFVLCLESDGRPCWARQISSSNLDGALGIAVSNEGIVAVSGFISLDANFGEQRVMSAGGTDAFVARYRASDGGLLSVLPMGGSGDDQGEDVSIDRDGNLYVSGVFSDTVNFSGRDVTAIGEFDMFVTKVIVAPIAEEDPFEEDDDINSASPLPARWAHSERCPAWLARLVDSRERCEGIFNDAADADVFNNTIVPGSGSNAPPRAAEMVWSMRVTGRTLTRDADFYRVTLPDPAAALWGEGHANINPGSPPGSAEPLIECGNVQRQSLPVGGRDNTVYVNVSGRLSIRLVPAEDRSTTGRGVRTTEPVQLYNASSRVTDFSVIGNKGWTVYCPRSRHGINEAVFSIGEGILDRSDFDMGAYDVELEYVLEINRGIPVWAADPSHFFGRGILFSPDMADGWANIYGQIPFDVTDFTRNCLADGPGCWDIYSVNLDGINNKFEIDSLMAPGMKMKLLDINQKVMVQSGQDNKLARKGLDKQVKHQLSINSLSAGTYYLLVGGTPGQYKLSYQNFEQTLVKDDTGQGSRIIWVLGLILVILIGVALIVRRR